MGEEHAAAGATSNQDGRVVSKEEGENPAKNRTSSNQWLARGKQYMRQEVTRSWADLLLILCFFISGLVDSVAFNVWNCFASMQTGNTIFVGLGVSGQPVNAASYSWAKSLIAIACFALGSFFFSNFHRYLGPLKRHTLFAAFSIQTVLIVVAAVLVTSGAVTQKVTGRRQQGPDHGVFTVIVDPINWKDLAPLALLSFQASGQAVASRMLKYNELPTVVLTSLYCDLMSDAQLLTAGIREDSSRNRRAVAAVTLFVGAVSGGYLTKSWAGLAGALWIAAFLKGAIVLAWLLWKKAPPPAPLIST